MVQSFPITRSCWILLLLLLLITPPTNCETLPDGFTLEIGPAGAELVWTPPNNQKVRMGDSRPEFRLATSGKVFGYPREMDGKLVLILSNKEHALLATNGQDLEVWSSGRRGALTSATTSSVSTVRTPAKNANATVVVTTPTVMVDPAARGTASTQNIAYTLPGLQLNTPDFPLELEVVGDVIHPMPLQSVSKHPLVLFLHGRHASCYQDGPDGLESGEWPCPEGWLPTPSHEGYRYVADLLASQGYVVVSIAANGINGQDFAANDGGTTARSILVRHHLALWAKWNTDGGDPWSSRFRGKLDMYNVVLVGHSRGGEGVNRAAVDTTTSDPFQIVGLVSYGPTAAGRQVTPDIHSATILPTCDGDVFDLQGQAYVDGSRDIAYSEALRSAVIALGCNHNYFNTEWTPGLAKAPSVDDWFDNLDPVCGSEGGGLRLTADEQQVVGAAYTAALIRLAVKHEAAMLQLLDGSFVRPKVIGRADVATQAVGGAANRLLYRPEDNGSPILRNGMSGFECLGYSPFFFNFFDDYYYRVDDTIPSDFNSTLLCGGGFDPTIAPHWQSRQFNPDFPAPQAMELSWTDRAGAFARFNIPSGKNNLTSLDWVDVRVANDPSNDGVQLELVVLDRGGRKATLLTNLTTIEAWPSSSSGSDFFGFSLDRVHARTFRGSLASVRSQVNLNRIVAVLLVARSATGRVWVIDIAASQARIQQPVVLDLPKISVESFSAPEGDGLNTFNLNITADKPLKSPGSIWVNQGSSEGYQIDLPAGSSTVIEQIEFSFIGDKVYSATSSFTDTVAIAAVKGVVTSNYIGAVNIVEDDPVPMLLVNARKVTASEGQSLIWKFRLSAPTVGTSFSFVIVPPKGTELTSSDVPSSWLQASGVTPPSIPTPLSSLGLFISVGFSYGVTSTELIVPIASDRVAEGEESVVFEGVDLQGEVLTLVGTVPKHTRG